MGNELLGIAVSTRTAISTDSVNHTLLSGSNRIVYATVYTNHPSTYRSVSAITYGGVGMTLLDSTADFQEGNAYSYIYAYYVLEANLPTTGVNSLAITYSGSSTFGMRVTVFAIKNAKQEVPEVTYANCTVSGSSTSSNDYAITVLSGTDSVFCFGGGGSSPSWMTWGQGQEVIKFDGGSGPYIGNAVLHEQAAGLIDPINFTIQAASESVGAILWTVSPLDPPKGIPIFF